MSERDEESQTRERQVPGREEKEERRSQDRGARPPFAGHPPIIIPDGGASFDSFAADEGSSTSATRSEDIVVQFDGEGAHRHYTPEDPPTYGASSLKKIDFIRVEDGSTHAHICSNVPPNCRIEVADKPRSTGNASIIKIDATSGREITINFAGGRYSKEHQPGKRKQLRGSGKKIKSLKVFNAAGHLVHDCDKVTDGKEVRIIICDDGCVE